jgi:Family of unknown function (DUF6118)
MEQEHDSHEDAATKAFNTMTARIDGLDASIKRSAAITDGLIQESHKVAKSLAAIAATPGLQLTPVQFGKEIESARSLGLQSGRQTAAEEAKAARARDFADNEARLEHRVQLAISGWYAIGWGAPFVVGFLTCIILGAALPDGNFISRWASGHSNGWTAGSNFMRAADPVSWEKLVEASQEMARQQAAIMACRGEDSIFPARVASTGPACIVTLPKPANVK